MNRRAFLTSAGVLGSAGLAGCLGIFETEQVSTSGEPPVLEDPPDAVYVPTHREGMAMADVATAGRYRFALTYSFPHRFWTVRDRERNRIDVRDADDAHVMIAVWDDETGTILPSSNTPLEITKEGDLVTNRTMWGMLSQNMGVHFGDNVELAGAGTYEVSVDFGPLPATPIGAFDGALGDLRSVEMNLEFSPDRRDEIDFERLSDREGERDALPPMDMEMMPTGRVPEPGDLPGEGLGQETAGDAVFAATVLDSAPAGLDGSGPYLAVSARTPYNRYPIPRLSLTATVDGTDVQLAQAIHPEFGYHYGAVLADGRPGGDVTVTVDTPPTIARHEGYETAFFDFEPVTMSA